MNFSHILSNLIVTLSLKGRYDYPHFSGKEKSREIIANSFIYATYIHYMPPLDQILL